MWKSVKTNLENKNKIPKLHNSQRKLKIAIYKAIKHAYNKTKPKYIQLKLFNNE